MVRTTVSGVVRSFFGDLLGEIVGLSVVGLEEIVGFSLGVFVALEFGVGGSSNMSSPYEILGLGVVGGFLFGGFVGWSSVGSGGGSSRISSPYAILG